MKALLRVTPFLVVLMTPGLAVASDKKGSATATVPTPGSVDDLSKPASPCLTCLTQDTVPKQTSQGTTGQDPDKYKKVPTVKVPKAAPSKPSQKK